jgi:hypothetical protein
MRSTGIQCAVEIHMSTTTIQSSCSVTVLVPEFISVRGPPQRQNLSDLQGFQGVARPGLEPGTPRFSVVEPNLSNSGGIPANTPFNAGLPRRTDHRKLRSFLANLGTETRSGAQSGRSIAARAVAKGRLAKHQGPATTCAIAHHSLTLHSEIWANGVRTCRSANLGDAYLDRKRADSTKHPRAVRCLKCHLTLRAARARRRRRPRRRQQHSAG